MSSSRSDLGTSFKAQQSVEIPHLCQHAAYLHSNVFTVHVLVNVSVNTLRHDARVPEEVLGAQEHEFGQHHGIASLVLGNFGLSHVILKRSSVVPEKM